MFPVASQDATNVPSAPILSVSRAGTPPPPFPLTPGTLIPSSRRLIHIRAPFARIEVVPCCVGRLEGVGPTLLIFTIKFFPSLFLSCLCFLTHAPGWFFFRPGCFCFLPSSSSMVPPLSSGHPPQCALGVSRQLVLRIEQSCGAAESVNPIRPSQAKRPCVRYSVKVPAGRPPICTKRALSHAFP